MKEGLTLATISGVVAIIIAWISITKFVMEPLDTRLELARQNYTRALLERDARMEYLQRQIDELERQLRPERGR